VAETHPHAGERLGLPQRSAWLLDNRAHSLALHEHIEVARALLESSQACCGCGLISRHWQEIHHRNGDHDDWSRDNLAVICPFCHRLHHAGAASLIGELELIWLPELTQAEAIQLARLLYVAAALGERTGADAGEDAQLAIAAATLLGSQIRDRQMRASNLLGSAEPHRVLDLLWALPSEALEPALAKTAGVRYWPTDAFLRWEVTGYRQRGPEMIQAWLAPTGPYGTSSAAAWNAEAAQARAGRSEDLEVLWNRVVNEAA
jgi:hypothetical protein